VHGDGGSNRETVVIVTHRDLRDVVASYLRVRWISSAPDSICAHMEAYVRDHLRWASIASLNIGYERIMSDELGALRDVAACCGLPTDPFEALEAVKRSVKALQPPMYGSPCPVSKLWPEHLSGETQNRRHLLSERLRQRIHDQFVDYQRVYGYA